MCANFQKKQAALTFWAQIFPKMDFWRVDSKSAPPTYVESQFSVKITLIFWPKFGGNCLATCDILIGILLRVLQRAGWRLNELSGDEWSWVEVEMSWVEVDGAGWRWVHGLVIRTFKTPWGKLPNLLEMKLTADVTWLFLSSVNTDIFVYFFCYRCGLWK